MLNFPSILKVAEYLSSTNVFNYKVFHFKNALQKIEAEAEKWLSSTKRPLFSFCTATFAENLETR